MDPRTVRYEADTDDEVGGLLWAEDDQRIQAAGWHQVGAPRWVEDGDRPAILIDYVFDPPATIIRRIAAYPDESSSAFSDDAIRMAAAGYIPERQRWIRQKFLGVGLRRRSEQGILQVTYSYRPDQAGEPVRSIPWLPDERGPRWGAGPRLKHHRSVGDERRRTFPSRRSSTAQVVPPPRR